MSDRHLIVSTSQPYHCIEATTVLTVLTYLQGRHQVGVAYSPLGHFGLTETVQQSTITPLTKTFRNTMLCSDHQPYHSLGERHGTWPIRCVRALSPTSTSSSSQLVTSSDCNMINDNDVAHEGGYMDYYKGFLYFQENSLQQTLPVCLRCAESQDRPTYQNVHVYAKMIAFTQNHYTQPYPPTTLAKG